MTDKDIIIKELKKMLRHVSLRIAPYRNIDSDDIENFADNVIERLKKNR